MAEYIDGHVAMIMETHSDDAAMVFMFTETKDLKFTIGMSSIKFANLD